MTVMRPKHRAAAAAIAGAVAITLISSTGAVWAARTDHHGLPEAGLNAAVVLAFTIVGAVIVAARPGNRVGWFMLAGGALWALGQGCAGHAYHGVVARQGSVPGVAAFVLCAAVARALGWYFITLAVPLYFPDGRLRWRWLRWVLLVVLVASVVDPITDPQADTSGLGSWHNPVAPSGAWRLISLVALLAHIPVSFFALGAAVAQLVVRWRHGGPFLRQQLTLFAAAAVLPVVAVPIAFTTSAGGWIFGASAVPLPFAIGFAILAHGLYDLRTAANRTLLWLTLSAVVVGLYAVVIGGVSAMLWLRADVFWLPWAAAAVVAISFAPLRDALHRGINRLTFGRWEEPYDVLAALGQRMEATADVAGLLAEAARELRALGLCEVSIRDGRGRLLAGAEPTSPDEDLAVVPLSAYAEPVGSLRYRPPDTPLRTRDRRLLEDLAGQLGGLLHAHRLTGDLRQALERLVLAREEERRRLRRDLHDGLGPALAGHLLRLEVLAGTVGPDSPAAAEVAALREDLRATVLEVRRVVEGLRPPALDELGLAGALRQALQRLTVSTPVIVMLQIGDLPPLSAAMEVAAFRIVTEAVTNVVRHGAATNCHVEIDVTDGQLRIVVRDDGQGLDSAYLPPGGHGLQTMRERAEELRGRLQLTSAAGTTVQADLPLAPA